MLGGRALVLRRGGRALLEGVDISVPAGELTVVLGPNGAGKSSLLALLSGAVRPTTGEVTVAGRPLRSIPPALLARHRAVLRQNVELSFELTAREVVELGRSPHRGFSSPARDRTVVGAAMQRTDVLHLADRIFPTLSGGERQRVQIARVLAQLDIGGGDLSGRLLLLDEPNTGLDLRHQLEMLELARELARQGCAVLAVLHDLGLAARYADRVVILHRGRVAGLGPPADALTAEVVGAVFGLHLSWVGDGRGGSTAVLGRVGRPSALHGWPDSL
jgi:iron complex transport system ATP-binding protein